MLQMILRYFVMMVILFVDNLSFQLLETGLIIIQKLLLKKSDLINSISYNRAKQFSSDHQIDLIIMKPSMILGPGDDRFRSTQTILSFLERNIPLIPPGGYSFVDVRDVAKGFFLKKIIIACITAMVKAKPGSTYLLASKNGTLYELFTILEGLSGVSKPRFFVPGFVVKTGSVFLDFFHRKIRGNWNPSVDPVRGEMGVHYWSVSSDKVTWDFFSNERQKKS